MRGRPSTVAKGAGRDKFQEGFLEEVAFQSGLQGGVPLPHFRKFAKQMTVKAVEFVEHSYVLDE